MAYEYFKSSLKAGVFANSLAYSTKRETSEVETQKRDILYHDTGASFRLSNTIRDWSDRIRGVPSWREAILQYLCHGFCVQRPQKVKV